MAKKIGYCIVMALEDKGYCRKGEYLPVSGALLRYDRLDPSEATMSNNGVAVKIVADFEVSNPKQCDEMWRMFRVGLECGKGK